MNIFIPEGTSKKINVNISYNAKQVSEIFINKLAITRFSNVGKIELWLLVRPNLMQKYNVVRLTTLTEKIKFIIPSNIFYKAVLANTVNRNIAGIEDGINLVISNIINNYEYRK